MIAAVAAEPSEAACQDAAGEKLAQFPLDKERQPVAAATLAGFGEKRLKVLPHHLVQNGALGLEDLAGDICFRVALNVLGLT